MFAENALIKLAEGSLEEFVGKEELWQVMDTLHLKFEKWSKSKHSRPLVIDGFGGWIKIKNFQLDAYIYMWFHPSNIRNNRLQLREFFLTLWCF